MQAYCRPHISPETTEVIYEFIRYEIDLQIVFFFCHTHFFFYKFILTGLVGMTQLRPMFGLVCMWWQFSLEVQTIEWHGNIYH